MSPCAAFLEDYQYRLQETRTDDDFLTEHEAFLRDLGGCSAAYFASLSLRDGERRSIFFRACHLRSLFLQEKALTHTLQIRGPLPSAENLVQELFGPEASARLRALDRAASVSRHAVLVGCGPVPVLLLWLLERHPHLQGTGLEVRSEALALAVSLVRGIFAGRLTLELTDGAHFDYSGADLVYVANQVAPKRQVLERIAATAPGAAVIVRDPFGHGWLLAEPVADCLPAPFAVRESCAESGVFFSRDLVLEAMCAG